MQMEQFFKEALKDQKRTLLKGLAVLGALYFFSGIYFIAPGETGVHLRLGQIVDSSVEAGVHLALPRPVDQVYKVPVKVARSIIIDDFTPSQDSESAGQIYTKETGLPTYCISGDNNILTIELVLQYSIKDAGQYLFSCVDADLVLREIAKASLIQALSSGRIDSLLTTARKDLALILRSQINQKLDQLAIGLMVQFVDLKSVAPPKEIQKYFDDVINSGMDARKMANEMESYRNQKLSSARGQAEENIQIARAYKTRVLALARGESQGFLKRLQEFEKMPDIFNQQLYLEFVQSLAKSGSKKIYLDQQKGFLRLNWPQN